MRIKTFPFRPVFSGAGAAILLCCLLAPRAIYGQTPPPPETGAETAATQTSAAATADKWTEDLTVGAQIDQGRSATRAISIEGDVWKKYGFGILRLDVTEAYGSLDIGGSRITSLNRQYGAVSWIHTLSPRFHISQINSIERDTIRLIDYRASSLNVLGMQLKHKDKLSFDFGPGFAIVVQQKYTPQIDGLKFDGGAFYSLDYKIDPRWNLVHWATFREDVSFPADRLIDSAVSLTGMITKGIGVKFNVAYNYEGVLATGNIRLGFNTKGYLTTTVGLTLHH